MAFSQYIIAFGTTQDVGPSRLTLSPANMFGGVG